MDFLQPIPKEHYIQYGELSDAEVLSFDHEAKIVENYPDIEKYIILKPFRTTDPIYLNPKPLKEHFIAVSDKIKPIIQALKAESTRIDGELTKYQNTQYQKDPINSTLPPLFWRCSPSYFQDLIRKLNFLNQEFWMLNIQKHSVMLSEVDKTIIAAEQIQELSKKLIESPANVVFRIRNLELFSQKTTLCQNLKMRQEFNSLSHALESQRALIKFFQNLIKPNTFAKLSDTKYLERYIDPTTHFSQNCALISVEIEDMLLKLLERSSLTTDFMDKKKDYSELEMFCDTFFSENHISPELSSFYKIPMQRLLFGESFKNRVSEKDQFHVQTVNNAIDKLIMSNESIHQLFEPNMVPAIESAIKWIDELTFAFFPYDFAFFVNEAVSCIEQKTSGMPYNEEVPIVCACIAKSYLPDPINIMDQLLEIVTRRSFPKSMRDRCNIFVSACQMLSSFSS